LYRPIGAFPAASATIFFYQKTILIEFIYRKTEVPQKIVCRCFPKAAMGRYSDVNGDLKG
jgi:hypothetical protein